MEKAAVYIWIHVHHLDICLDRKEQIFQHHRLHIDRCRMSMGGVKIINGIVRRSWNMIDVKCDKIIFIDGVVITGVTKDVTASS